MGKAKELVLRPIPAKEAREFVRRVHYSGKVDTRSQVHLGVFWHGSLEGALQFGPSLDKRRSIGLVDGTQWHQYLDLHRPALTDRLPRNSESRAIAIAMRLLRRHAPQVKWVLSYADAAQCGDGTIYRASGFVLTGITPNRSMYRMPDGQVVCKIVFEPGFGPNPSGGSLKDRYGKQGSETAGRFLTRIGAEPVPGFQLRYIYFLDPSWRSRLTVPEIPFSRIQEMGAGMYRGEKRASEAKETARLASSGETGGASPTRTLWCIISQQEGENES